MLKYVFEFFFYTIASRDENAILYRAEQGPPTFPSLKVSHYSQLTRRCHVHNIIFYIAIIRCDTPRVQHVSMHLINILYMRAIDAIKLQRKTLIKHTHTHTKPLI